MFKDYLASDLTAFINTDEFADTHDIDGQQVNCVSDSDVIDGGSTYDGVYSRIKKLYVKAVDLPARPARGQHIRVDDELYIVAECTENLGMLEITLEANRA